MGFGNTFVDVLRRLVGLKSETPVVALDLDSTPSQAEPGRGTDSTDGADIDDDPVDEESLRPVSARDEWEDMQAFVARCEAEAIDLGGINIDDPASFWRYCSKIEPASEGEEHEAAREARAKAAGFADLHHWEWVSQYCQIKWSELIEDCDPPEIRAKPSFSAAAEKIRAEHA